MADPYLFSRYIIERVDEICSRSEEYEWAKNDPYFRFSHVPLFPNYGFILNGPYVKEREEEITQVVKNDMLGHLYDLKRTLKEQNIDMAYMKNDFGTYSIQYAKNLYGNKLHRIDGVIDPADIHRELRSTTRPFAIVINDYFERIASDIIEKFREKELELIRSNDCMSVITMDDYLRYVKGQLEKENIEFEWSRDSLNADRYRLKSIKRIGCRPVGYITYVNAYLAMECSVGPKKHADEIVKFIINKINEEEKKEMHTILDASNVKVNIGNRVYTPGSVQINSEPKLVGPSETTYTIEVNTTRDRCERKPTIDYSMLASNMDKRRIPEIKKVHFNDPVTVVLWADNTKTIVRCENEEFDPEKGLAMAIAKKALGNTSKYFDTFKKHKKEYAPKKTEKIVSNIIETNEEDDYKLEPNGDDE
jgi:hypothetical protein